MKFCCINCGYTWITYAGGNCPVCSSTGSVYKQLIPDNELISQLLKKVANFIILEGKGTSLDLGELYSLERLLKRFINNREVT